MPPRPKRGYVVARYLGEPRQYWEFYAADQWHTDVTKASLFRTIEAALPFMGKDYALVAYRCALELAEAAKERLVFAAREGRLAVYVKTLRED
jgi:hypothetical protein